MSLGISVIIPVTDIQNRRLNLMEVLTSSLAYKIHFILIGDSEFSADHDVLFQLKNELPSVSIDIITGKFGSAGSARNVGLRRVETEWVAFLDSDDFLDFPALLNLVQKAKETNADLAVGGLAIRKFDENRSRKLFLHPNLTFSESIGIFPGFTRNIYRRTVIQEISFPNLSMGEDQSFLIAALEKTHRIMVAEIYFYNYRVGFGPQETKTRRAFIDLLEANQLILTYSKSAHNDVALIARIMYLRNLATIVKYGSMGFMLRNTNQFFSGLRLLGKNPIRAFGIIRMLILNRVNL